MSSMHEWLSNGGLARVSEEVGKVTLPSIRLIAHPAEESQLRVGSTKFGGSPDLPQETRWPEWNGSPLPFVAQINLAEVAPYDLSHLLPATGILAFFFDQDAFFESRPADQATSWQVCYTPGLPSDLWRLPIPEHIPQRRRYRPSGVTCAIEMTLPDYSQYDSTSVERLGLSGPLTDEEEQAYHSIQAHLAGTVDANYHIPIHRLLGHPDDVQWDMHRELGGASADWQLLFQVDSDNTPDTDWGDTGRIYYWIRTRDLAERHFIQVQVILQCT
jgi:uncharacterized protein YwqG